MYHKHGDTGTRLYRIWKSMKCRCYNRSVPAYTHYGARGIQVCDEWIEDYPQFKRWALSHGYEESLELDRINVNGGYSPENCRWISHHEQTLNRRDTLYVIVNGQKERFRDFCERNGINLHTVNGWRHLGIETQKISEIIGVPIIMCGGKKGR